MQTTFLLFPFPEGFPDVSPWEAAWCGTGEAVPCWDMYENLVRYIVQFIIDQGVQIDYWDFWSEPTYKFHGTEAQFLEMLGRAARVIHSFPGQKIVAPSVGWFYDTVGSDATMPIIRKMLPYLAEKNLYVDAVSWHEFGWPEDVSTHVFQFRSWLQNHPEFCQPSCPEIHINEFTPGQSHLIPGWTLGYLYYLDKASVDWASRSCWWEEDDSVVYNSCVNGWDGVFQQDNHTPQHLYWVHRFYADTAGGRRLPVQTSWAGVVGLASRHDDTNEVRLLIGSFSCGKNGLWCEGYRPCGDQHGGSCFVTEEPGLSLDLYLLIEKFPFSSPGSNVQLSIQRIPNQGIPGPLPQPLTLAPRTERIASDGSLLLVFPDFGDGDVYNVIIKEVQ